MKKVIAICIVASMAAVTFGCSGDKNSDSGAQATTAPIEIASGITADDLKAELSFSYGNGDDVDATEAAQTNNEDPVENPGDTPAETVLVTEVVNVTEADGQPVTDADGVAETEVVVVGTEAAEATEGSGSSGTQPGGSTYTPEYDICTAYWFDTSQMKDFFFEGQFLVIDFVINETTPDGNYPITISKTDIGSWELVTQVPTIVDGEVAVGDAQVSNQASAADDEFTLVVNSVSGQPGDTVSVAIDLKNNPGFVGFIIDVKYDKNALTIADTRGGADFDAAVNYVE